MHVKLASPRGFCAGVERAIRIVEDALSAYGPPVYVRHEIVHNIHVVSRLKAMGAVFVEQISEAPADRPIIFSAHGAPRHAHDEARHRLMFAIDATCPLVLKVHAQTRRLVDRGRHVLLIGHAGHPEVEGTMGQVPEGAVSLIQSTEDCDRFEAPDKPLAYVTQTTLSVDDTAAIVDRLKTRFPSVEEPRSSDICYATSNRQAAVKAIAKDVDMTIVIGSPSSSNSCRLVEVAVAAGCARAQLLESPESFDLSTLEGIERLGVTAGASAPESLIEVLLAKLAHFSTLTIETVETATEDIVFKSPMLLAG